MSGPVDRKQALRLVEGGRVQVEREIVRALAVGNDAAAVAGMELLERRASLSGVSQRRLSGDSGSTESAKP